MHMIKNSQLQDICNAIGLDREDVTEVTCSNWGVIIKGRLGFEVRIPDKKKPTSSVFTFPDGIISRGGAFTTDTPANGEVGSR